MMQGARFIPIFCALHCGIFGYASTDFHPSQTQTIESNYNALELNHRTPKQLQPSQNVYASKNFIKSKLPQNNGQPQLFNLGYSVRFENQQNQNTKKAFEKPQRQQGDIITGTRKQNVEIDIPGSNENIEVAFQKDVKKRKIFGLKSAPPNSENIYLETSGQTYVSPTTQKNLEALGKIKDVDYQDDLSQLYEQKYTWRNLSPNVKIIRSTEIPTERIENRALSFDHERALSKSEGFGFSDAIKDDNFDKSAFVLKENIFKRAEKIPTTTEDFRIIHVQETINEPPVKPQIITAPEIYTPNKNTEQESFLQVYNRPSQVNTQPQVIKLPPSTLLKPVDGTPLKSQLNPELIKAQVPKQAYIQHIVLPQIQYESTPKYRGKFKYVKHIPGSRGNMIYARKVPSNFDYTRKGKIKPELRREFKPPPVGPQV